MKNIKPQLLGCLIAGILAPCNPIYAQETSAPVFIATGKYFGEREYFPRLPLLLTSFDQGQTWAAAKNISNYPTNLLFATYDVVTCTDNQCLVQGGWGDEMYKSRWPLYLVSENRGQSWSFTQSIPNLPTKFYCNKSSCIGGGWYNETPQNSVIKLSISNDGGKTWMSLGKPENFPNDVNLKSVAGSDFTCTDETCIMIGTISESLRGTHPYLVISKDKGKSWTYIADEKLKGYYFGPIHCKDNYCFIVGKDAHDETYLQASNDKGQNWFHIPDIANMPSGLRTLFNDIPFACNNNTCVAKAGDIIDNPNGPWLPYFIFTKDNGHSWTYTKDIKSLPSDYRLSVINSIACTENTCIAVGEYHPDAGNIPLILVSNDEVTWTSVSRLSFPPLWSGNLSSVKCVDKMCVAVGGYSDAREKGQSYKPLILISLDAGYSWKAVDDNNMKLPSDLKFASMDSVMNIDQ